MWVLHHQRDSSGDEKSFVLFEEGIQTLFAEQIELEAGRHRRARALTTNNEELEVERRQVREKWLNNEKNLKNNNKSCWSLGTSPQTPINEAQQNEKKNFRAEQKLDAIEVKRARKQKVDETRMERREDEFQRGGTKRHLLAKYRQARDSQRAFEKKGRQDIEHHIELDAQTAGEQAAKMKRQLVVARDELTDQRNYEEMRKKFEKVGRRENERRVKGNLKAECIENHRELREMYKQAEIAFMDLADHGHGDELVVPAAAMKEGEKSTGGWCWAGSKAIQKNNKNKTHNFFSTIFLRFNSMCLCR